MPRRPSAFLIAASLLALAVPAAPAFADDPFTGWSIPGSDVTPDPAVIYGTLENGMRYAIRKNAQPEGAAAVRLSFNFGSLAEAEDERGLAHFIEHMVFNGTTNVPEGEMVKMLERLGLAFGADTNASTGFDRTTYQLDLPVADKERLDAAFFLMRETASEVLFDPAAIDRERGVILGERRAREGVGIREITDQLGFFLPDTPYSRRLPIGAVKILESAEANSFRSLYQRYYRPENAVFVFVGDADPAEIEARIKATFGDWRGVGEAGAPMDQGRVDFARPFAVDTFVDPAASTNIEIDILRPYEDDPDTLAWRREAIVTNLAVSILNRRLAKLTSLPDTPITGASLSLSDLDGLVETAGINVSARDGAWAEALAVAEQELRRALTYGFTDDELALAVKSSAGSYRTAADRADSRTHAQLAAALLSAADDDSIVTTPAFRLSFFEQVAPTITAEEVSAELKRLFTGSAPLIHLSAKEDVAPEILQAAYESSIQLTVAESVAADTLTFAYDDWGAPTPIVSDHKDDLTGIRTLAFGNGVKLNIKTTDFEPGKVSFTVRMAGGHAAFPADKPGLGTVVGILSTAGGTGKHSLDELRTLTAGRPVRLGVGLSARDFTVGGTINPDDLDLQLKVAAAYLTDPGFRPEADNQWANLYPQISRQVLAKPESVAGSRLTAMLTGDDWRFGLPDETVLAQRSLAEAKDIWTALAKDAPIEIGIVGSVDEEAAIAAVAQSFGALPTRATSETFADRPVALQPQPAPVLLYHDGEADSSVIVTVWPTDDDDDVRTEATMDLLAAVMDLKMTEKLREELGATYSASVDSSMSSEYDGFGTFFVGSTVDPARIDEVEAAVDQAVAELRDAAVDTDLLARARNPIIEGIREGMKRNGSWIGVVDEAQSEPARIARLLGQEALYAGITAEEILAAARTYLTPEKKIVARILPRSK